MQPTPFLVAISVLIILIGLGLWRYMPEIWRGGAAYERGKRVLDFYGEPMATSVVSAFPIGSLFLVLLGALGLLLMIKEADFAGLRSAAEVATIVAVPVLLLLLLLFFAVFLFGQPRFLMPPHLRTHRGLVPELLLAAYRRTTSRQWKGGARRRR